MSDSESGNDSDVDGTKRGDDDEEESDLDDEAERGEEVLSNGGAASSKALPAATAAEPTTPRPNSALKKRRRKGVVTFCVTDCMYPVIINAAKAKGWKLVGNPSEKLGGKSCSNESLPSCNIHWVDVANIHERLRFIQPWQRVNHFPGMPQIARKGRMAQALENMRKECPKDFAFYPRTWILPTEMGDFRAQFDSKGKSSKVFILKPDAGCQGRGIFLTQDISKIPDGEAYVAQQYIRKPLLLDGFKFDLRLYVLVSSVAPLRMYLFHNGLARLCTDEYVKPTAENLENNFMHLTNYAINKNASKYVPSSGSVDAGVGSKRSLKWFMEWLAENRGDAAASKLWQRMGSLCVKVVLSILPQLQREYASQFEKSKGLREYRRKQEATAAAEAAARAAEERRSGRGGASSTANGSSTAGGGGGGDDKTSNGGGGGGGWAAARGGFGFGAGRDDATHRQRRREAAIAAAALLEAEKRKAEAEELPGANQRDAEACAANGGVKPRSDQEAEDGSHCFEILGIDIMVDNACKPWLIEINHLPSFATDSPLDLEIKTAVIEQVLQIVRAKPSDKKKYDDDRKRDLGGRLYGTTTNTTSSSSSLATGAGGGVATVGAAVGNGNNNAATRPVVSPVETTRADASVAKAAVAAARARLEELYTAHAPEKLGSIDALLAKYKGKEIQLLSAVESKYGASSSSHAPSTAPAAAPATAAAAVATAGAAAPVPPRSPLRSVVEKRPNSAGLLLPAAPGAAPLSPQRPSANSREEISSRGVGAGGGVGGERSVAASFLPNDSDWRPDRATLPSSSSSSSSSGGRRRGSSGSGNGGSSNGRSACGLTPRQAALSREAENSSSSSDLPRSEEGGWHDAQGTGNNGSSRSSNRSGASSKQSWANNTTATAAATASGVQAAPAPDAKKLTPPPISDWCTPAEARRRLGTARQAKWRSGMSDAQHRRVVAEEENDLEDWDRIFPVPDHVVPPPSNSRPTSAAAAAARGAKDDDSSGTPTTHSPTVSSSSSGGQKQRGRRGLGEQEDEEDDDDNEGDDEEEELVFVPDYDRLMAAAATVDAKRMRRMYGRAAATTPSDGDGASSATSAGAAGGAASGGGGGGGLPPLGGSDKLEPRPANKPISKVVGKQQALAAERLSRGASVKQTQPSAAAAAAANGVGGNFVFDPMAGGEDGAGGEGDVAGLKYAEQVAYAKQWRQRVETQRQRRSTAVALKPTTFAFAPQDTISADARASALNQPSSAHFGLGIGPFGGPF